MQTSQYVITSSAKLDFDQVLKLLIINVENLKSAYLFITENDTKKGKYLLEKNL